MMIDTDRYNRTRTYRGWTIRRTFPSGYWQATGRGPNLLADTLAGMRELIRHVELDHDCRCATHQMSREWRRGQ